MGNTKKLKTLIKDDRPLKLKAFVASHNIQICKVKFKHGKNILHYCSYKGSPEMLKSLLKLGCDASLQDKDGNLPLHVALQRGLREDVRLARETLVDIVMPLIDAYPMGQDVENKVGSTGQDLLKALKRLIKSAQFGYTHKKEAELEAEKRRQEEDELWRQKLSEEATFEYEEHLPRYDCREDFANERTKETFEEFSERIRKDYSSKQRNGHYHRFWRDRKRKDDDEADQATRKKRSRQDDDNEKLKKAREEMKKNFKPAQVQNRNDRLLLRKQRYESKFSHLLGHLAGRTLTFGCIPWPCLDLSTLIDVLFCDLSDKESPSYRKYLRSQQVRWHPDKFTQKFGDHLHPNHVPKIMARVKAISQTLNQHSSERLGNQ